MLLGLGGVFSLQANQAGIHIHNVPIEVLLEGGVIAFTLFATSIYSAAKYYRGNNMQKDSWQENVVPGCLLAFHLLLSLKQRYLLGSYALIAFVLMAPKTCLDRRKHLGTINRRNLHNFDL
jgi:O-antigen ligase